MHEVCEFEGKSLCGARRGIAIGFERSDDLIPGGDEAALFAPIDLKAAGAQQKRESQGADEYSDPARVDEAIRSSRLNGFYWRIGFHCMVSSLWNPAKDVKRMNLSVNIHAALRPYLTKPQAE